MIPKKGNEFLSDGRLEGESEFRHAVSTALRSELGSTHRAIKTVMRWTGANERTVKHWFAGRHSPSSHHLAAISRHSDEVLMCFLVAANRPHLSVNMEWVNVKTKLERLIQEIDALDLR